MCVVDASFLQYIRFHLTGVNVLYSLSGINLTFWISPYTGTYLNIFCTSAIKLHYTKDNSLLNSFHLPILSKQKLSSSSIFQTSIWLILSSFAAKPVLSKDLKHLYHLKCVLLLCWPRWIMTQWKGRQINCWRTAMICLRYVIDMPNSIIVTKSTSIVLWILRQWRTIAERRYWTTGIFNHKCSMVSLNLCKEY